jgi:hypothetical protein
LSAELVVRAATVSDRAAATGQRIGLVVVDDSVQAVATDGRSQVLCAGVRSIAWAPWSALPKDLGVVNSSGAVVLTARDGVHVFPVDAWWMDPAPPATPRQAVASSGFEDLAERLGLAVSYDPDSTAGLSTASNATAHVPLSNDAMVRSRRVTTAVALFLAATLLPLPLILTVFARGWSDGLMVMGWVCVAASATALVNVVVGVLGRRPRPTTFGERILRPTDGPRWFQRNAHIDVDHGIIAIADGRWRTILLATPLATGVASAVMRARVVRGRNPRIVLIDGADVVRAELPLRFWSEQHVDALLAELSIIRDGSPERRSSGAVRFDTNRGAGVPGASLVTWTSLGVVPLLPLALATVLQLMVSVFARIGGASTQAAALTLGFASIAVLLTVVGVELGRRLPWAEPRPLGFRPSRVFASVVGWFVLFAAVCAILVSFGEPGAAWYAAVLAIASTPFQWCLYRHRAIRAEHGVLDLFAWLGTGCRGTERPTTTEA